MLRSLAYFMICRKSEDESCYYYYIFCTCTQIIFGFDSNQLYIHTSCWQVQIGNDSKYQNVNFIVPSKCKVFLVCMYKKYFSPLIKRIKKTHLVAQNEKQKKIVYLEGVLLLSLWHVFKHLTIHPPLSHYYYCIIINIGTHFLTMRRKL